MPSRHGFHVARGNTLCYAGGEGRYGHEMNANKYTSTWFSDPRLEPLLLSVRKRFQTAVNGSE